MQVYPTHLSPPAATAVQEEEAEEEAEDLPPMAQVGDGVPQIVEPAAVAAVCMIMRIRIFLDRKI